MKWIRWTIVLAAAATLVGCGSGFETVATETGNGMSPVENYKEQRMKDALRGLSFETGRVSVTAEAAEVARAGSEADGARLAAEADAVFQTNDFPAAVAAYARAIITAPGRAESYLGLAQALVPKGRVREAEAAVRTALDLEPGSVRARVALARLIDSTGDPARTVAAWQDVLARDPKVAEAHGRIAVATYYQGDAAGALRHIEAAERLGGQVPLHFKDTVVAEAGAARAQD